MISFLLCSLLDLSSDIILYTQAQAYKFNAAASLFLYIYRPIAQQNINFVCIQTVIWSCYMRVKYLFYKIIIIIYYFTIIIRLSRLAWARVYRPVPIYRKRQGLRIALDFCMQPRSFSAGGIYIAGCIRTQDYHVHHLRRPRLQNEYTNSYVSTAQAIERLQRRRQSSATMPPHCLATRPNIGTNFTAADMRCAMGAGCLSP